MPRHATVNIRNIALVGHASSGKTSFTDSVWLRPNTRQIMLHEGGALVILSMIGKLRGGLVVARTRVHSD